MDDAEILDTDLMIVPVHRGTNHWSVIGIYLQLKVILFCDSFHSVDSHIFETLLEFLKVLYDFQAVSFRSEDWSLVAPSDIAKQHDSCSCGVYSCIYAYCMMEHVDITVPREELNLIRYWIAFKAAQFTGERFGMKARCYEKHNSVRLPRVVNRVPLKGTKKNNSKARTFRRIRLLMENLQPTRSYKVSKKSRQSDQEKLLKRIRDYSEEESRNETTDPSKYKSLLLIEDFKKLIQSTNSKAEKRNVENPDEVGSRMTLSGEKKRETAKDDLLSKKSKRKRVFDIIVQTGSESMTDSDYTSVDEIVVPEIGEASSEKGLENAGCISVDEEKERIKNSTPTSTFSNNPDGGETDLLEGDHNVFSSPEISEDLSVFIRRNKVHILKLMSSIRSEVANDTIISQRLIALVHIPEAFLTIAQEERLMLSKVIGHESLVNYEKLIFGLFVRRPFGRVIEPEELEMFQFRGQLNTREFLKFAVVPELITKLFKTLLEFHTMRPPRHCLGS